MPERPDAELLQNIRVPKEGRSLPPTSTPPDLLSLARFWFRFGLISWGGMYAMLPRLEAELAERGWLARERFHETMAAATLVPGPTFLSLAGLVGYQVRGAAGAAVSLVCLMLPPTLLVLASMVWIKPEHLSGPLAPITRGLSVAVTGVLLGNAWRIAAAAARARTGSRRPGSGWPGSRWPGSGWSGPLLTLGTAGAILAGLPVPTAVVAALAIGALLMREVRP